MRCVAAIALAEACAEGIEQLLDRRRGPQDHGGLAARMQRIGLGQGDHLLDQRAHRLCLGDGGDDALVLDDAGAEVSQQRVAAIDRPA